MWLCKKSFKVEEKEIKVTIHIDEIFMNWMKKPVVKLSVENPRGTVNTYNLLMDDSLTFSYESE